MNLKRETEIEPSSQNESGKMYFDCMADEFVSGLGLNFTMREYKTETYMFAKKDEENDREEMKRKVLESERVIGAVNELCSKEGMSKNKATDKAKSILDEIAHTFNLKTIRFMAFMLSKIVKRMFRHVYVNRDGISKLSKSVKYAPLVLVPSHNSYFDFLLTSLVCFTLDLPLPAIASGQDFLNIAIVNRLLRGSGAYFLRRSFASDHFYKSIFTEYVQHLIKAGQMPVEFFLEGTRSRSGKALPPKTGMLSMITEMFFLGHVPDIQFCPISISYECIAEEQLYVFELLGIPKPKESLSGLVKASKVLSTDYGSAYLHFGDVVSLREFCNPSINRAEYALFPRYLPEFRDLVHGSKEKKVIRRLARYLVDCQQAEMMIYPRSIVAAAVLQNINSIAEIERLLPRVAALLKTLHRCVHDIDEKPMTDVVTRAVALSSPVLSISKDRKIDILPFDVSLDELRKSTVGDRLHRADRLSTSLSGISLSLQRNKLMHALLIPAYVASALQFTRNDKIHFRDLIDNVSFMFEMFQFEFVRHPDIGIAEATEQALHVLETISCIKVLGHNTSRCIQRVSADDILLQFLEGLIRPFLESFWLIGQCLMSASLNLPSTISKLTSEMQILGASTYTLGILTSYESISLQTLKNGISSYVAANCLSRSETPATEVVVEKFDIKRLWISITRLGRLAALPDVRLQFDENGSAKILSKY